MEPIAVPDTAKARHPEALLVAMGPPAGMSDEDCGTAEMLVDPVDLLGIGGRGQYAYFKPNAYELAILNDGGVIEFCQYGRVVQPFSATVLEAS